IGIGVRWLGVPRIWRAIRAPGGGDAAGWRLLAWTVVSGVAGACVLTTGPYVGTLQFFLAGPYPLWYFAAAARVAVRGGPLGLGAVVRAVVLACPAPGDYRARKWTDRERPPRVALTRDELAAAEYLRQLEPERTVVLHDRPLTPSLTTIVAARRIVLGWDVRYS